MVAMDSRNHLQEQNREVWELCQLTIQGYRWRQRNGAEACILEGGWCIQSAELTIMAKSGGPHSGVELPGDWDGARPSPRVVFTQECDSRGVKAEKSARM
jgi:hypothetical protein